MPNGKCRGCELKEREIEQLKAQLTSEKEKDTIARFEQYEAGN